MVLYNTGLRKEPFCLCWTAAKCETVITLSWDRSDSNLYTVYAQSSEDAQAISILYVSNMDYY